MLFTSERSELLRDTVFMLGNIECRILETLGEGTSCIVYKAQMPICIDGQTLQRTVVLKELYPKGLEIARKEDHSLDIPESSQPLFDQYMFRFKRACQRQIELRNDAAMTNATTEIQHIYSLNNTLYSVMGIVTGDSYEKERPEDLRKILNVGMSLAHYIAHCHEMGFLYLDIKPANILNAVLPGDNVAVRLFDFDTVVTKEEAQKGDVSYSEGYAAPEVKNAKQGAGSYADIREQADLFSIGSVIFEKIMGRCSQAEDHSKGKRWDFSQNPYLRNAVPQLQKGITELFRKTLARNPNSRYVSAQELKETLEKLMKLADIRVFLKKQRIAPCTPKSIYMTRKTVLSQIAEKLKEYHMLHLYAIGGSGKSETAREFAQQYAEQYDFIQSVFYSGSLKKTIANLDFVGLEDKDRFAHTDEEIDRLYKYKYGLLGNQSMYGDNTLLIIDNYDYNSDPESEEYKQNINIIHQLGKLPIYVLFTTRRKPSDSTRCLDLSNLSPEELRELFFRINPTDKNDPDRIALVDEIIKVSYYHTMTVKLVAMQSAKYRKPLSEYLDILTKSGLNSGIKGRLTNEKDGEAVTMSTVYEHIKALFDFEHLSEPQKYIMVNACLLPLSGLETGVFSDFIGLSGDCLNHDIEDLINSGWIEYADTAESQLTAETKITLHPLIGDLVRNELQPDLTEEKCGKFYEAFLNLIDEWGNLKAKGKDGLQQENRIYDLFSNIYAIYEDYHIKEAINCIVISSAGISFKHHILISDGEISFEHHMIISDGAIISYFGNAKQLEIPADVTHISSSAFEGCSTLTQITIPDSVKSIGDRAFDGCSSLIEVTIPDSVTSIEWGTFSSCTSLTSVTIPDSVTSIKSKAFSKCTSLTSVTIPASVTTIEWGTFSECTSLTSVTIPDSVASIEEYAFCGCTSLTSITIGNSVTSVGDCAFKGCSALTSIILPVSLKHLGNKVFENCISLKCVSIPDQLRLKEIGEGIFDGCVLLSDTDSIVKKLEEKRIKVPYMVRLFRKIIKYIVPDEWESDVIAENPTPIATPAYDKNLKHITIPEGTCFISYDQFRHNTVMTDITIPSSVTELGKGCFEGCSSLHQISLPNKIKEIPVDAFKNCTSLMRIDFPKSLLSIEYGAFENCVSLTQIKIPDCVTEIGFAAFKGCFSLAEVTLPDSVTYIGRSGFHGCSSLTTIIIPIGVKSIESFTFFECASLNSITIPDGVEGIGWSAFAGCASLVKMFFPDSVTYIGEKAFDGCNSLNLVVVLNREVDLSKSLIGYYTDNNGLYRKKDDMTIKGYRNSTAEQYAQKNSFDFVPLD